MHAANYLSWSASHEYDAWQKRLSDKRRSSKLFEARSGPPGDFKEVFLDYICLVIKKGSISESSKILELMTFEKGICDRRFCQLSKTIYSTRRSERSLCSTTFKYLSDGRPPKVGIVSTGRSTLQPVLIYPLFSSPGRARRSCPRMPSRRL